MPLAPGAEHATYAAMNWRDLDAELDRWRSAGSVATLWWRDDDACRDSSELERLLALARAFDVPLALAVIPAALEPSLAARVSAAPNVTPIQHGYAHRNHAPPGARKAELGAHRTTEMVIGELEQGARALALHFGARAAALLVPPWNRIAGDVASALPTIGVRGLSTFGPRASARPAPGLVQCNTHVDIVDWRGARTFVGAEAALGALVGHLEARREGRADAVEATGLLTHHLVHDEPAWRWLHELLERTRARADVQWLPALNVFSEIPAVAAGRIPAP